MNMQQYLLLHQNDAKGVGHHMVCVICAQFREPLYVVGHKCHSDITQLRLSQSWT